jgi:hypothetical protein
MMMTAILLAADPAMRRRIRGARDEYSRRRAEGDRAEIDRLGSEMARRTTTTPPVVRNPSDP